MELSIIIVSYNVEKLVLECIVSIYKYLNGTSFEIVLVDNHSADNIVDAISKQFPEVHLIKNTSNIGFSEANNQGIKVAKGDYILLLNPDTYLIDDSLKKILAYAKTLNNNTIIAPKLLNGDLSIQTSAWKDKGLAVMALELIRIFIDRYPLKDYTAPQTVENVAGAAMLFPKSIVYRIGYLDRELFWMEDFDFCYRLRQQGGRVMYFPESSIVHYGGKSSAQNLTIAYANANISKLKFYEKHSSSFRTFPAEAIIFIHITSRLLLFMVLSPFNKSFRNQQFSAYAFTLRKYFKYLVENDRTLH
jgi:GT2 family glycosyltransferase